MPSDAISGNHLLAHAPRRRIAFHTSQRIFPQHFALRPKRHQQPLRLEVECLAAVHKDLVHALGERRQTVPLRDAVDVGARRRYGAARAQA